MKFLTRKKQACISLLLSMIMLFSSFIVGVQPVFATGEAPTVVSVVTDRIGKKVTVTFNKDMADPSGLESQFTVTVNGVSKPITSLALASDNASQIQLNMTSPIGYSATPKTVTLSYTAGDVVADDDGVLQSFSNHSVTNNIISLDIVDFDSTATETGYDTSDPTNPKLSYKYDNPVDYDNVNLAWYFPSGFFRNFVTDLASYVKFTDKATGVAVPLPNAVTVGILSDGTLPIVDGYGYMEITDWYFRQIQYRAPLGLKIVSQALAPSTTYVVEIDKGFLYNNGASTGKTYKFEFTTTDTSETKPSWQSGSNIVPTNLTNNSVTLNWPAAQDNHCVTSYNIYKNSTKIATLTGGTLATSYNVTGLTAGTAYNFKVEAVDFAGNLSDTCLLKTVTTSGTHSTPPTLTADTSNNILGNSADITFPDNAAWRAAISGIIMDGKVLNTSQYTVNSGDINIIASALTVGSHSVVVCSTGYSETSVTQVTQAMPSPTITADTTDNILGNAVNLTFTDNATWRAAITSIKVDDLTLTSSQYSMSAGNLIINSAGYVLTTAGNHTVTIEATNYNDVVVTQAMTALITPPTLTADSSGNTPGSAVDLPFTNANSWQTAINGITVDGTNLNSSQYTISGNNINIHSGILNTSGNHIIFAKAPGFEYSSIVQPITGGTSSNFFATTAGYISTIAGNGTSGSSGNGGVAKQAQFNFPMGAALDASGNVYISDIYNHVVREVANTTHTQYGINMVAGNVYAVAGNGTAGYSGDGGQATSAKINTVEDVAVDPLGNLYIADTVNCRIRKVATNGVITTVVGNGTSGNLGDSGLATNANIGQPYGISFDAIGNIYFCDYNFNVVREVAVTTHTQYGIKMVAGNIYTVAGTGDASYNHDDIPAVTARINHPNDIAVTAAGDIYISDSLNYRVRKVAASTGNITTVAGTGTEGTCGEGVQANQTPIGAPMAVAVDGSGNLYFNAYSATYNDYRIHKVTNGIVTTVAGTGTQGYTGDGGLATSAQISIARRIEVDKDGNIFFTDGNYHVVRYVQHP